MGFLDNVRAKRKPAAKPATAAQPKPAQPSPTGTPQPTSQVSPSVDAALERLRRENAELRLRSEEETARLREQNDKLLAQMRLREEEAKRAKIRDTIRAQASKSGAINEDAVADLLLMRHQFDLQSDGSLTMGGKSIKPDEFVASQLSGDMAYLAKPKTQQGTGANPFPQPPATAPASTSRTEQIQNYVRSLGASAQPPPAGGTSAPR